MNEKTLKNLLSALRDGRLSVEEGIERLRTLPFEDAGVALVDHHRELRQGFPEVVFGEGKSSGQLLAILNRISAAGSNMLVTRLSPEKAASLLEIWPEGKYDPEGRTFTAVRKEVEPAGPGKVIVVCAGTSDLPVAREAVATARFFGCDVDEVVDVGVAGIHRLFAKMEILRQAAVLIVVAGMEGALPSVVGGVVPVPVIAVPTSVGYGAAFGGVAALLGMLNSCAGGVTVVNIDNGFGAAFAAARIVRGRRP